MSESLVRLAKEWRESGSALIASHPTNSEHSAIGRTLLRCARELEFALKNTHQQDWDARHDTRQSQ